MKLSFNDSSILVHSYTPVAYLRSRDWSNYNEFALKVSKEILYRN